MCLFLLSLVAGPILLGLAVVHLSLARGRLGVAATSAVAAALGLTAFACGWAALENVVVPENTFVANPPYDTLRVALGALLFAVYPALGLAAIVAAASAWCVWRAHPDAHVPRATQPESLRDNARGIVLLTAVLLLCVGLSSTLSPVWNYSPSSYFSYVSPQAINPSSWAWRFGADPDPGDISHSSPVVIIKIYEDVIVWYAIIACVAAGGAVGLASKRARRLLHTRVTRPFAGAPRRLLPSTEWRIGVTIGELLLVTTVLAYTAYFVCFWLITFPRMYQEATEMNDPYPATQTAARLMGHITTLTMSLLSLPIARNSVWEAVWGVPFERALRWHRLLGRISWLAVTAHMLLWQAKWLAEGGGRMLWNNCTSLTNLLISQAGCPAPSDSSSSSSDALGAGSQCVPEGLHSDNWTIPVAEAAWLALTASLVVAIYFRRANYELFRVTHLVAWLYYAVAVMHAWSHWYYTCFGLVLIFVDKVRHRMTTTTTTTTTMMMMMMMMMMMIAIVIPSAHPPAHPQTHARANPHRPAHALRRLRARGARRVAAARCGRDRADCGCHVIARRARALRGPVRLPLHPSAVPDAVASFHHLVAAAARAVARRRR